MLKSFPLLHGQDFSGSVSGFFGILFFLVFSTKMCVFLPCQDFCDIWSDKIQESHLNLGRKERKRPLSLLWNSP